MVLDVGVTFNEKKEASDYLCAALDGFDPYLQNYELKEVLNSRIKAVSDNVGWIKVGMELFYSTYGKFDVLNLIKDHDLKIFLDLKMKDIPYDTIKNTSAVLTARGVNMFNVHADGSTEMLKAVIEGAREASTRLSIPMPKIIAVTVLTSMDETDLKKIGIHCKVRTQVLRLARLAYDSGLDGIVCSALELEFLKKEFCDNFLYITPGIRSFGEKSTGQKRIATPEYAISQGSDLLVIGRPIYDNKTYLEQKETVIGLNKIVKSSLGRF